MRKLSCILTSGRAAAIGLVSILLGYLAAQGVSAPLPLVLACTAVFCYVVITCGGLLLRAAHASQLPPVAAWPLGVTATGLALLVLVTLLPVTAAAAFALWAAMIIALDIATARLRKHEPAPDRADLVSLVLCCAFTAVWCKDVATVPVTLANSGRLPAWIDYFLHAGVISQFGDVRAIGRGAIWLADTPGFLYHYASYMLPAAFASPLDQPGLPLATSLWVPIGFLSLAAAAYTLGAALAGAAGGVAALAALFLMPDASNFGLRNGFFSFHWSLVAIPTTSYALGTSLLAVVFLHRWIATRSQIAFAGSAALVGATLLFRMHVFILLFPAWLGVVAMASRTVQQRRTLFLILAGAFAVGAVLALRFAHLPPEMSSIYDEGRALERFLYQVHRGNEPTGYQGLYQRILTQFGESVGFTAGVLLVYPACLGVFIILYPLALSLLRGRLQLGSVDGFPLALLVAYAALMLLAPIPAHHDPTEFTHRPFVLLYALVAVWTAASLVRWLSGQGGHGVRLWQTLVVGTTLALPLIWTNAAPMARPKFNWGRPLAAHAVPRDLLAAADILRVRARPGDTFATSGLSSGRVPVVDAPTELVALTGVPTYLARLWIHEALGGATRIAAMRRYFALGEVAQAQDRESAMQKLRDLRVRWYVVTNPGEPAWDTQRSRATWARGAVAIYDSEAPGFPR